MMSYVVSPLTNIEFAPSDVYREIIQNVRTILATRKGSVPLDREFGLSWDYIDAPLQVSRSMAMAEIITAVGKYEPRCRIESVDFDESESEYMEGILIPRVTISINEEG